MHIQDIEIRNVGGPIVLGEIPGVVAIVGCANYPEGNEAVAEIAEEFAKRRLHCCSLRMCSNVCCHGEG